MWGSYFTSRRTEKGGENERQRRGQGGNKAGEGKKSGRVYYYFKCAFVSFANGKKAPASERSRAHTSLSRSLSRESERYYRTLGIILYFTHLLYTMILYFTHLLHLGVAGRT